MTQLKRIPIDEATDAQLRDFANVTLDLGVHHLERGENLKDKIRSACNGDFVTVSDGQSAAADDGESAPSTAEAVERTYTVVYIDKGEDKIDQDPVFISHQGISMWVERGKDQPIPTEFLSCLTDAVRTMYHQDKEGGIGGGPGPLVPTQVKAYPFRVVGTMTQAERDAWAAEQAA